MTEKQTFDEVRRELGKPYEDLQYLLEALHEILMENNEAEIASKIPLLNESPIGLDEISNSQYQTLADSTFGAGETWRLFVLPAHWFH